VKAHPSVAFTSLSWLRPPAGWLPHVRQPAVCWPPLVGQQPATLSAGGLAVSRPAPPACRPADVPRV